jgi:uroporphyrinogen decarboxylase
MQLVDIKEHLKGDKVKIDIITLDSEGCAPCQYMVEAVKEAVPEFGDKVVWKEYKIKTPEGIRMMASLGVKNIPTTCIDGEIVFISRIPPKERMVEAIAKAVAARAGGK